MLTALAPQLEGHVTPLRLVVPYDDHARLQVSVTRTGYKPSKRSLIPMNNENFIVELQPETPQSPATSTVTNLAIPVATTATAKKKPPKTATPTQPAESVTSPPPETKTDDTPELKDRPKFDVKPPVKGG
jgi:hypothetical protein